MQVQGQEEVKEAHFNDDLGENELSNKETRQVVTPYAFFVSDELLGTPLARPFRRGFALCIDLFLISLLTQVNSLVLAGVAAWTFFRAGNRLETKKRFNGARIFLRLLVASLLFVLAVGLFDEISSQDSGNSVIKVSTDISDEGSEGPAALELLAITSKYLLNTSKLKKDIDQGECQPAYECIQSLGEELVDDVLNTGINNDGAEGVIEGYLAAFSSIISANQEKQLINEFMQRFETQKSALPVALEVSTNIDAQGLSEPKEDTLEVTNQKDAPPAFFDNSIIVWLKGLAEDLGLGFGWAAFYFSVFTAWWKGQTPGKKLMSIKVVKLDNQPLNLWESFGRYGGYGAGLATGLLGFLQIFWDPNRQGIQDKISETLVIDMSKVKIPFLSNSQKNINGK